MSQSKHVFLELQLRNLVQLVALFQLFDYIFRNQIFLVHRLPPMDNSTFTNLLQQRESETLDFKQDLPASSDLAIRRMNLRRIYQARASGTDAARFSQ